MYFEIFEEPKMNVKLDVKRKLCQPANKIWQKQSKMIVNTVQEIRKTVCTKISLSYLQYFDLNFAWISYEIITKIEMQMRVIC